MTDRPCQYSRAVPVDYLERETRTVYALGPVESREAVLLFNEQTRLTAGRSGARPPCPRFSEKFLYSCTREPSEIPDFHGIMENPQKRVAFFAIPPYNHLHKHSMFIGFKSVWTTNSNVEGNSDE